MVVHHSLSHVLLSWIRGDAHLNRHGQSSTSETLVATTTDGRRLMTHASTGEMQGATNHTVAWLPWQTLIHVARLFRTRSDDFLSHTDEAKFISVRVRPCVILRTGELLEGRTGGWFSAAGSLPTLSKLLPMCSRHVQAVEIRTARGRGKLGSTQRTQSFGSEWVGFAQIFLQWVGPACEGADPCVVVIHMVQTNKCLSHVATGLETHVKTKTVLRVFL